MASLKKLLSGKLAVLANNGIRRHNIHRYDKKIAKLEQEYRDLLSSPSYDVSRLAMILSEMGKLWNAKLREEEDKPSINGDGAGDIWQIEELVREIVSEGRDKMGKARSEGEIHSAFKEGIYKKKCLFDD